MNRHVLRRACWATLLCLSVSIVPSLLAQQIARKTTQAERPNIILMLCDNHGYGVARSELFDLETDPWEENNQFAKRPEIVARLLALAEKRQEDLGERDRHGDSSDPTASSTLRRPVSSHQPPNHPLTMPPRSRCISCCWPTTRITGLLGTACTITPCGRNAGHCCWAARKPPRKSRSIPLVRRARRILRASEARPRARDDRMGLAV